MPCPDSHRVPNRALAHRLAWLWGLALLICALGLAWLLRDGLPADTRLTAMLPEDRQSPLVERADDQLGSGFEDRFILLLASPSLEADAQALADQLRSVDSASPLLARLDWRDLDLADNDPRTALDAYRYRLLTPEVRAAIDADGGQSLIEPALRAFFSPAERPRPVADPFGLLDRWLAERDASPVQARNGLLLIHRNGRDYALMIGHLASTPYDLAAQQVLTEAVSEFTRAHPEASLLRSGLIFHAAAGAQQARREITTIGLGALVGLVVILLVVFRSPRVLAQMLLPLVCGLLFALPLTLALFGRLHLMTLAFGASLIGIAIDYALHLQCDRAIHGRDFRLRRLLPGLALGLVSSLLAYLAQALTPLPGLRQMAVFAALGLLGAWLTVVLWLPHLHLPSHSATARLAERLWQWTTPRRRLTPRVALIAALACGALVGGQLSSDDSLRLLSSSSAELLDEERQVQRLLGNDTGSRYLLVSAPDEATLLTRLETLGDILDDWIDAGATLRYVSLADSVPSPATQEADLARLRRLYGEPLASLLARAGLPESIAERARERLDDVPLLDVSTWLATPLGDGQQRLWLDATTLPGDRVAATLLLTGIAADAQGAELERRLTGLAQRHDGVTYVDRIERISALLGQLRRHIALWVAVAVAGLTLVLTWRYRRRTWRVLTPPLGAILGVLVIFAAAGMPLNVFSQLGLLLVLGIGLDAGIFSVEHAHRPSTWLAISLSTLTSLLAFGLLAFSATPALHYLGLSCLLGLAIVWLLVPWVRPRHNQPSRERHHVE